LYNLVTAVAAFVKLFLKFAEGELGGCIAVLKGAG
jgi:hypothetical protein